MDGEQIGSKIYVEGLSSDKGLVQREEALEIQG